MHKAWCVCASTVWCYIAYACIRTSVCVCQIIIHQVYLNSEPWFMTGTESCLGRGETFSLHQVKVTHISPSIASSIFLYFPSLPSFCSFTPSLSIYTSNLPCFQNNSLAAISSIPFWNSALPSSSVVSFISASPLQSVSSLSRSLCHFPSFRPSLHPRPPLFFFLFHPSLPFLLKPYLHPSSSCYIHLSPPPPDKDS